MRPSEDGESFLNRQRYSPKLGGPHVCADCGFPESDYRHDDDNGNGHFFNAGKPLVAERAVITEVDRAMARDMGRSALDLASLPIRKKRRGGGMTDFKFWIRGQAPKRLIRAALLARYNTPAAEALYLSRVDPENAVELESLAEKQERRRYVRDFFEQWRIYDAIDAMLTADEQALTELAIVADPNEEAAKAFLLTDEERALCHQILRALDRQLGKRKRFPRLPLSPLGRCGFALLWARRGWGRKTTPSAT
jgi:hypothetical protein